MAAENWACTACETNNSPAARSCRQCGRPASRPVQARPQTSRPAGGPDGQRQNGSRVRVGTGSPPSTPTAPASSGRPYREPPVTEPGRPEPLYEDAVSWTSSLGGPGSAPAVRPTGSGPALKYFVIAVVFCLVVALIWQAVSAANGSSGDQSVTTVPSPGSGAGSGSGPTITMDPSTVAPSSAVAETRYERQQGPGGLSIELPSRWVSGSTRVAGNLQAADPTDPDIFVRYGATPQERDSIIAYLAAGERSNPNIQSDYQRIGLQRVSYLGAVQAADWEFTFSKDGLPRHVLGRYWYRGGHMYVIYGSSSADRWDELRPALDHALRTAAIG